MPHVRITTDPAGALEHLDAAVRLRAAGTSFDLALRLDDDRGVVAALLARDICESLADPQARRAALARIGSADQAVGQNPLLGLAAMSLETKATVRDLAMLARSLVFRSWAEMRRAVMNFDILHHAYTIEAPSDDLVPPPVTRDGHGDGSVVIWAPDEPRDRLHIVVTAAEETGRAVHVACKDADIDAASALLRASVCVSASLSDPGPAIALAKWGIPLCATFTSGAYEWLDGVVSYRSWSVESAKAAIASASGVSTPAFAPSSPLHIAAPEIPKHDAVVTVVVRTHGDAPSTATVASIERQAHTAREIRIASSAQGVRDALASATGTYVAFVQDGDVLFHDGLAALVHALEPANGEVAYGDGLIAYHVDAPGPRATIGYAVLERMPVTARTMAANDEFVGAYFRVLFRRASLARMGLDEGLDELAIYEAFVRTLGRANAVRVDTVCGMTYRYLDGRIPGSAPVRLGPEYERIYARVPAADAAVSAAREAVRARLRSHDRIGLRPPPQRLSPPVSW